jgi:phospholipase C
LRLLVAGVLVASLAAVVAGGSAAKNAPNKLDKINHIVVIYEENHSFDNLYGTWEGVNGVANASAATSTQVGQNGTPYACLLQNDVNLTSPSPLTATCNDAGFSISSAFPNGPFLIDAYIPSTATTCPNRTARSPRTAS